MSISVKDANGVTQTVPTLSDIAFLTDTQLRATPVPISDGGSSVTVDGTVAVSGTVPVSGTFYQATQPVSAASLPLPTGAATETTLNSVNNSVVDVYAATNDVSSGVASILARTPVLGQGNMAGSSPVVIASNQSAVPVSGPLTDTQLRATAVPVSGTFWQATQPISGTVIATGPLTDTQLRASAVPVSGTVTANAGTNLNTSALALESGGNLASLNTKLPAKGAATVANSTPVNIASDQTVNTQLAGITFTLSSNNSSSAQLAAGATYTGTTESAFNQPAAQLLVVSDQPFTAYLDQFDGNNTLISTDTFTRAAGVPLNENVQVNGDSVRVRVVNTGSATTTTLRIETTYGPLNPLPRALTNSGNLRTSVNEISHVDFWRAQFDQVVSANGIDPAQGLSLKQTGTGMAISQSSGTLVVTSGTTANAETLVRSTRTWSGPLALRYHSILSQRIINNNFDVYLADLIGEGLAYSITNATTVVVTHITANPFTAANVGQGVNLSVITGAAGIPMRAVLASVSGLTSTWTVAGWPASGSGTLTMWGWNFIRTNFNNTTATNAFFDCQFNGWQVGDTTLTVNTSASPGTLLQVVADGTQVSVSDGLLATGTAYQFTARGNRSYRFPAATTPLYLFIRALNGTTNPASTTTWTVGFVSVEQLGANRVVLDAAVQRGGTQMPAVNVVNAPSVAQSGTWSVGLTTASAPAAAAAADGYANPTITHIGADNMLFNGTSWDRYRANFNTTTGDTGAKTATGNGATQTNFNAAGAILTFVIGTVSGTTPTCVFKLQGSGDSGTTFYDIPGAATASLTATGNVVLAIYPGTTAAANAAVSYPLPRTWRVVWTIGGTTPSFTITAIQVNYIN